MTTAAEILVHALALPPDERAGLARSLLSSWPDEPRVFHAAEELHNELADRLQQSKSGQMATFDANDTLRRVQDSLATSRGKSTQS